MFHREIPPLWQSHESVAPGVECRAPAGRPAAPPARAARRPARDRERRGASSARRQCAVLRTVTAALLWRTDARGTRTGEGSDRPERDLSDLHSDSPRATRRTRIPALLATRSIRTKHGPDHMSGEARDMQPEENQDPNQIDRRSPQTAPVVSCRRGLPTQCRCVDVPQCFPQLPRADPHTIRHQHASCCLLVSASRAPRPCPLTPCCSGGIRAPCPPFASPESALYLRPSRTSC